MKASQKLFNKFWGEDGFIPPKYWFYGRFMRFAHKHGWHHAPRQYPARPYEAPLGIDGKPITEWFHWCTWCGLRGKTIDVSAPKDSV